jgi:hypothetical protein
MKTEIEVTIKIPAPPDGWVFDGFRKAKAGEMAFCYEEWVDCVITESSERHPIAVKAKQYREPVLPADEGRICEFCDDDKNWHQGFIAELDGYRKGWWLTDDGVEYEHCRIEVSE